MTLKKYKKFNYDYKNNKILSIGKKELYPFVYKRLYDLTIYDNDLLALYGLKKAIYVYIGQSNKYNLTHRSSAFCNQYKNTKYGINKVYRTFLDNLINFYTSELNMEYKEVIRKTFYNAEIIARCKNKKVAEHLEKIYTSECIQRTALNDLVGYKNIIVLSTKDSYLKPVYKNGATILKYNI